MLLSGSEVSSTWKFSHSGVVPTGNFRQFEENNMVMERENADGGASNSFIQNDKEEDYYYTTPISAQMSHSENKTRSIGEGRSASSSPSIKNMQYSNLQNRVRQLQPENSRYGISEKLLSCIIYSPMNWFCFTKSSLIKIAESIKYQIQQIELRILRNRSRIETIVMLWIQSIRLKTILNFSRLQFYNELNSN